MAQPVRVHTWKIMLVNKQPKPVSVLAPVGPLGGACPLGGSVWAGWGGGRPMRTENDDILGWLKVLGIAHAHCTHMYKVM